LKLQPALQRTAIGAGAAKNLPQAQDLRCSKILHVTEFCSDKAAGGVIFLTEIGAARAQNGPQSTR
jgi:hypothetical protein